MPKWETGGKMMIWDQTGRGRGQQSGDLISDNVYGLFFLKEAFERFNL